MWTKERLLQVWYDLMQKNWFIDTSVNQILERSKIPKWSFYHHFKNKLDFINAILDKHLSYLEWEYQLILNDKKLNNKEKLKKIFEFNIKFYLADKNGSPFQSLLEEIAETDEKCREKILEHIKYFKYLIENLIDKMKSSWEIQIEEDSKNITEWIINSRYWAMANMKLKKSYSSMASFFQFVFYYILK